MVLISPSLPCLASLVAGDLATGEHSMRVTFPARIWPDDPEMREGLAVHLAACSMQARDLGWRVFLVAAENDVIAGHAGFKGGPDRMGDVEIYWCVEPGWRRRGIAKAVAARLCAHAFESRAVGAVTATIARTNVPSQHVAAALGMQPVGRELKHGLPLWRVTRSAWQPLSRAVLDALPVVAATQTAA